MKTQNNFRTMSFFAGLIACAAVSFNAHAKTVTWTGTRSAAWSDAANWNNDNTTAIPSAADFILIPNTANHPVMDADVTAAGLTIDGNTLTMDGKHSLTVNGNVTVKNNGDRLTTAGSTLTIALSGNLGGNGTLDMNGNGKLVLNGDLTIAEIISGKETGAIVTMNGVTQMVNNRAGYHFNQLFIQKGNTILQGTNLTIDGNLGGAGTLTAQNNTIELGGDMALENFCAGTSTFVLASAQMGSPKMQHINTNSFYILKNYDQSTELTGTVSILHQLDFIKGDIILGMQDMRIGAEATLTWDGKTELDYTDIGLKGYFVSNGIGGVNMPGAASMPAKVRAAAMTQTMDCEIGLLVKQSVDVQAINLDACQKMDAARKQYAGNNGELMKAGARIDKERNTALRDVLRPAQWSAYERIDRGNKHAVENSRVCRKGLLANF